MSVLIPKDINMVRHEVIKAVILILMLSCGVPTWWHLCIGFEPVLDSAHSHLCRIYITQLLSFATLVCELSLLTALPSAVLGPPPQSVTLTNLQVSI